MRIAADLIVSLHYKMQMFCVLLTGPAYVFCNNQAVVNNSTIPESSKKHNQICYYQVHEAVAAEVICIANEDSKTNLVDILTSPWDSQSNGFS